MAVIAEGGPAGRGLADYMKWRNRRKMLKNIGQFRPSMDSPAIPLPTVDPDAVSVQTGGYPEMIRGRRGGGLPRGSMPTVTGAMPGTIPKDVMGRGSPGVPLNPFAGQAYPDYSDPRNFGAAKTEAEGAQYGNTSGTNLTDYEWEGPGQMIHGPEIKTFMGMPVKGGTQKGINRADDTAEWNPGENIYPRFMVDQLLDRGVITLDDIFDMGAADGDSWKIIPRGQGRMDEYRRS